MRSTPGYPAICIDAARPTRPHFAELKEQPAPRDTPPGNSQETELSRIVATLSRELLQSVEEGSARELLTLLTRIVNTNAQQAESTPQDRERLELLQSIAMRLRLDLHSMLAQIYQRLEAARAYVSVVRHLAGEHDCQDHRAVCSEPETTPPMGKPAVVLSWPRDN